MYPAIERHALLYALSLCLYTRLCPFRQPGKRMPYFRHIILPDSGADLLREELAQAFAALGLTVTRVHPDSLRVGDTTDKNAHESSGKDRAAALNGLLERGPALLFSVNMQGLSTPRALLNTLAQHGGKAAVWFVDNPWNLLAGVRERLRGR